MRPSSKHSFFGISIVLASAVALTGCGAGGKVVSSVQLEQQTVGNGLEIALDATLATGGFVLPQMSFPLYNPKNPSQTLGELRTDGAHVTVAIDASEALKLPDLVDGTTLPNGAPIPLTLPAGLAPVGIPVFNSSSRVYLAINGGQIMAGVAISIAKEDRLNLPLSMFMPFTISPELHGTAGFYLGVKQGVAVFALREPATPTPRAIVGSTAGSAKTLAGTVSAVASPTAGKIGVREEEVTSAKMRRLQKTWNGLQSVRID